MLLIITHNSLIFAPPDSVECHPYTHPRAFRYFWESPGTSWQGYICTKTIYLCPRLTESSMKPVSSGYAYSFSFHQVLTHSQGARPGATSEKHLYVFPFPPYSSPWVPPPKLSIDSCILPCRFIRRAQRDVISTGQLK